MTKRKVTRYPSEFKESSARLAANSKESIAQIAKNLGVHAATLHGWVAKYYPKATTPVKPSSQNRFQEELKQLRKENTRLREERDILKKAAAYFAKEIK
tara:strand:+ start:99 stop:395 length:297 start_codon:yes stop_codon:yes gene_type:complete